MYPSQSMITREADWIDQVLHSADVEQHLSSSPIRYRISQTDDGVILSLWETAPTTPTRSSPYLYMVNHRLPSEFAAQQVLAQYEIAYKHSLEESPGLEDTEIPAGV